MLSPPDGALRHPDPPVQRMLVGYTRVRADPIAVAFVEAICQYAVATPAHIHSLLTPSHQLIVMARICSDGTDSQ